MSPALQAFLAGGLKESGLRKLAKALDNSVQGVHALLLDHVAPAAEVATFILGELKGMAAAAEGGQLLGVSVSHQQESGDLALDLVSPHITRFGGFEVSGLFSSTFSRGVSGDVCKKKPKK